MYKYMVYMVSYIYIYSIFYFPVGAKSRGSWKRKTAFRRESLSHGAGEAGSISHTQSSVSNFVIAHLRALPIIAYPIAGWSVGPF